MKKENGITLISLVITIIVMMILTTISVYSGANIISLSKLTSFTTEMKMVQTKVNEMYQKYKDNETITIDGKTYTGGQILSITSGTSSEIANRKEELFEQLKLDDTAKIFEEEKDKYQFWSKELIKKLGIDGIQRDFFVNIGKRNVISYEGIEYDNQLYFTLGQLPNPVYNVQYKNPNSGKPTFNVKQIYTGTEEVTNWKITISNVQYTSGYIKKWQVKYKLSGETNWRTTDDFEFEVKKEGTCKIKLVNNEIESTETSIILSKPENTENIEN